MRFFINLFICLFLSACSSKVDKAYDKCGELFRIKEKNIENSGILKINKEEFINTEMKNINNKKYYEPKIENYELFEKCTKNYINLENRK